MHHHRHIKDLTVSYNRVPALHHVNLDISCGHCVALLGPNGAGKTTFARDFLPQEAHMLRFVNADLIASGLSPFNPEVAAIKAARLMLREIDECASKGESFSFETTLSGLNYLRRIKDWKADGYIVKNLVHLASLS